MAGSGFISPEFGAVLYDIFEHRYSFDISMILILIYAIYIFKMYIGLNIFKDYEKFEKDYYKLLNGWIENYKNIYLQIIF